MLNRLTGLFVGQQTSEHVVLADPCVVALGGLRRGVTHGNGNVVETVPLVQQTLPVCPASGTEIEQYQYIGLRK